MPPPLIINLAEVDLTQVICTREDIYGKLLPHRYEFELLDGVCFLDRAVQSIVAFADIREDAWWVRGHVPGRPLLPGVLMLEMAAQTSALGTKLLADSPHFIAFGGVDDCKFRDTVVPPARLYLISRATEIRPRRIASSTQGVVEGRLVFEARITGLTLGDV
jgi:3-hydroxyacyl-[acyl-carrier-protein] dehydratase